ncbi:8-oxo-dGTP pyrophosphatase MutT (NUDIX family) [Lipingzhangella halophila]|uniref:8-oxo-dGTP pyrophosphatase MutT (NUDIX family) n=1 Tax=Lipingzhangella halophila TaxID=1783352 RepID=A0A7W7RE04_9ACTN|nr:NUDIX hydrolase [Lipingzhangella halophila]MBB4929918.1 8-oxo-dGTP pyrophosphatase MutT (NUDIX family) [Lipingzhangella halophila]
MRLHKDAQAVLSPWAAPDPAQDALRREYLAHLARHPDGMRRECRAGHVTASAAIVDPAGERTVLTLHRGLRMWLQTGGHCEPDDPSLAAAALREATEESGISELRLLPAPVRLDRHWVPCGGGTWHFDVQYAAVARNDAELTRADAESVDLGWFPADNLPEPTDESCRALVRAAAQAARTGDGICTG